MRPALAVIVLVVLIILGALNAWARPARPCQPRDESLTLRPTGLAWNGEALQEDAFGRFTNDAGVQLYGSPVARADAAPIAGSMACNTGAQQLTVIFTDPWTGEERTIELQGAQ